MGNWWASFGVRIAAAILCTLALVWLALWYFIPAPPTKITMSAGRRAAPLSISANFTGKSSPAITSHLLYIILTWRMTTCG